MRIKNGTLWPEAWEVYGSHRRDDLFWVGVDLDSYRVFQSGGNEHLWYVERYSPDPKDITGQCVTLEHAIDNLRRYLAGEPVPDGDEITVLFPDAEPVSAPVLHNVQGERFVHLPERS
jgi:hypothetical protein